MNDTSVVPVPVPESIEPVGNFTEEKSPTGRDRRVLGEPPFESGQKVANPSNPIPAG